MVVEYANRNDKLTIVGGGLAGQQIDAAEVRELASLPSLDELRGKLIGLLQAPATQLARVLQAPAGQVARVFAAHAENQGESALADFRFIAFICNQEIGSRTWLIWQGWSMICRP